MLCELLRNMVRPTITSMTPKPPMTKMSQVKDPPEPPPLPLAVGVGVAVVVAVVVAVGVGVAVSVACGVGVAAAFTVTGLFWLALMFGLLGAVTLIL